MLMGPLTRSLTLSTEAQTQCVALGPTTNGPFRELLFKKERSSKQERGTKQTALAEGDFVTLLKVTGWLCVIF